MIYLTTGANGAGKTLCTLEDVRAQQLKENRPVYFHGFDMDEAVQAEFGWHKFDNPRDWMSLPDGAICLFDECQNEFGKSSSREVPQYILDLAQHRRKRGIDMWLITPHPTMLHVDVRRLIESPSWHRHFKRAFGANVVSVLKFNSPDLKCEEPGAGERAEVAMRPYPKHVFGWYRSASLHTGKRKVPRAVYVLGAVALAVPLLGWYAVDTLQSLGDEQRISERLVPDAPARPFGSAPGQRTDSAPMSPSEYAAHYTPRIPGFPHTAPAYEALTSPKTAPYPAACLATASRCECFSQQGTRLDVPDPTCRAVVARGFFIDWQEPRPEQALLTGDNSGAPDSPPVGRP